MYSITRLLVNTRTNMWIVSGIIRVICVTLFLSFFNILLCVNCFNFNSHTTNWFGEFSVEMNSNQYIYNIWSNPIGCLEIVYFKITARYLLLLRRDLYRALLAVMRDLYFSVSSEWPCNQFSRLLPLVMDAKDLF